MVSEVMVLWVFDLKKSKGRQHSALKIRARLPLRQQERNSNANAIETAVAKTNNSSLKPSWAAQAPVNRSTLRSADKCSKFQRAVETQQQRVWHVVSEVMVLGVCKASCKGDFPPSE